MCVRVRRSVRPQNAHSGSTTHTDFGNDQDCDFDGETGHLICYTEIYIICSSRFGTIFPLSHNNHPFFTRGNIQLFYPTIGTLRSWQQTTKIAAAEEATGWSGDRPAGEEGGEEEVKWLVPLPLPLYFSTLSLARSQEFIWLNQFKLIHTTRHHLLVGS